MRFRGTLVQCLWVLLFLAPGHLINSVSSGIKTCVIKACIPSEQDFMDRGDLCTPPTLKTPLVSATSEQR